ncbi:MAG: hypothetical protein FJY54_15300 [Betaproteobacteria bacterium]|nr:hypothetical protein [Betaproteobacteria bacterium]
MSIGREGALSLAGDSFFKRDVYVQEAPDGVALASDLSLLPDNPARDGYDTAALAHSMTYYGHRPPKRHTIYRAVRRLGVGESATVRSGKLEIRCAPFQPVMCEEYPDSALDRYAGAFLDYIAAAGSPEGNFVLLSSGWDSSSILAALVRVFGPEKITAVIGRMLYSERSGNCNRFEIERARAIAEFYGVKLHMVDLDYVHPEPEWMHSVRETFRAHNIQSITGLNHARLLHGAAQVGPGLPVFAGETSDGAHNLGFSQYVTIFHPTQGFREYSDKMACYLFGPTFLRELLAGRHEDDAVYRFFRDRNPDALFDDPAPDGPARLRQMLVSFFLRNGRMPLWSGRNVRMLTRNGVDIYTTRMAAEYFQGVESTPAEAIYSWYLHLYNSFHWQGSTVSTVQKMADLFGMRSHNPYWAAGIQDFLRAMPESWGRGLDLNPTKYPLKRMMREKFGHPMDLHAGPHSYTYDVDPTFNHSLEILHHSGLTGYAKKILARKPYHQVLSREMFDIPYLDGVVDKYLGGEEQRGTALNDLVSVFLLCQSGWYA